MPLERYSRQILYPNIGQAGQKQLLASRVVLIGCGALGSGSANLLVRAGVGCLVIADRDFLELDNLHRQTLFDEQDVHQGIPKAEAARRKLSKVNSEVTIEALVMDVNSRNIESLVSGCDLVLDGTDNFETRYLINDVCVKQGIPWVYGACIASQGLVMPILPGQTPCLRCVFESPPPAGTTPTCDTAGVVGPIAQVVCALQVFEGLKILMGRQESVMRQMLCIELWEGSFRKFDVQPLQRSGECPACAQKRFEYLEARHGSHMTVLCGRNSLQITPASVHRMNLRELQERLSRVGEVSGGKFFLRFRIGDYQLSIFPDGRAIIQGTTDESVARNLYAKYIGI